MTILAASLGLALGVTSWSPSAPLIDAPVAAAQLWQKPESASRGAPDPADPKPTRPNKETKKATTTTTTAPPASPAAAANATKKSRSAAATSHGGSGSPKSTDKLEAEVFGALAPSVRRKASRRRTHVLRRDDSDG